MDRFNFSSIPFQEPKFHRTRAEIPDDIRIQIVELLNQSLADTINLKSQILQAIWHVRGIHFYQFYLLFEEIAEQLDEQIMLITDRISALASTPLLTVRIVARHSQLPELTFNNSDPAETLEALTQSLSVHGRSTRFAIEQTTDMDDAVTANIYTKLCRVVDYHLWLLESHCITD